MVLSTRRYPKSGSSANALKRRSNTPSRHRRLKRRQTEFHFPKLSGRARQCAPVPVNQRRASLNFLLSCPLRPGSVCLPGKCGSSFVQTLSLNSCQINHAGLLPSTKIESQTDPAGNPECQQNLASDHSGSLRAVTCAAVTVVPLSSTNTASFPCLRVSVIRA